MSIVWQFLLVPVFSSFSKFSLISVVVYSSSFPIKQILVVHHMLSLLSKPCPKSKSKSHCKSCYATLILIKGSTHLYVWIFIFFCKFQELTLSHALAFSTVDPPPCSHGACRGFEPRLGGLGLGCLAARSVDKKRKR